MSAIKEVLSAVKEVLLLTEKVDQVGKTLSEVARELRDHDKRIIRLETFIEIGKMSRSG
jgi:uncharacterized protein YeeX (DUF496 family)